MKAWKPGPGWTKPGIAPVYDHTSGIRIHVFGHYRIGDKLLIDGNAWPESQALGKCIKVCGGNRKRGVMVWAMRTTNERRTRDKAPGE